MRIINLLTHKNDKMQYVLNVKLKIIFPSIKFSVLWITLKKTQVGGSGY